jgi:hypothetical protein
MATIVVNNAENTAGKTWETWGELLASLDSDLCGSGRIVTAARFDGVDEPAFRDPGVVERRLDAVQKVEVESGTPVQLLLRTLDDTSAAVDELCGAARRTSDAFRGFDIKTAQLDLAELAQGLMALTSIVRAMALSLHASLQALDCDGRSVAAIMGEMLGYTEALIAAQQAGDWLSVADTIEYDIEPALGRWQGILGTLRTACAAAA